MLLSWLAQRIISYVMAQNRAGNIKPALLLDRPDMSFVFPGDNSWSGSFHGRDAHQRWLERLVRVGVMTQPDEVVATGWPWRTTVCIRGRSWYDSPTGQRVYDNRFVIWAHLSWGRMKDYEVYEDTIRPRELDAFLARSESAADSPVRTPS